MQTVTFLSALHGAARLAGISDPTNELTSSRAADLLEYLNERFREAWEYEWWPDWTLLEQRRPAADYDSTKAYASGDFVWYPASEQFYQAIVATTGNAPAALSGTTYTTDTTYWQDAKTTWSTTDWAASTAYAEGDLLRNPEDGLKYACHTAHTSTASFDATKFGRLIAFRRLIAYEQTDNVNTASGVAEKVIAQVKLVSEKSPEVFPDNFLEIAHKPVADGILLPADSPANVWLTFREPAPEFTLTAYAAATAYVLGDTVYYSTTGECYECTAATTGNLPSNTAYWVKIDFPRAISGFVKRAVQSDVLTDQKQQRRAARILDNAYQELADAAERALEMQKQYDQVDYAGFA